MLPWAWPLLATCKGKSIKQVTGSKGGILPVFDWTHVTVTAATLAVYYPPTPESLSPPLPPLFSSMLLLL